MGVIGLFNDENEKYDKKYLSFEPRMLENYEDDEEEDDEVQVLPLFLESYYLDPVKFLPSKEFLEEYQYQKNKKVIVNN